MSVRPLWLVHNARDRERDRERKMMGFYITLCTVHTTQEQGQGTIFFYCVHPGPCPFPFPVPCSVYKPLGSEVVSQFAHFAETYWSGINLQCRHSFFGCLYFIISGTVSLWVQILSFSCSFWQKSCQIISFDLKLNGWRPHV